MNPMYMGCHSDSGFVHEVTGWTSQMLFGESFERPQAATRTGQSSYAWQHVIDSAVADRATVALDATRNFSGWPSMSISLKASNATAGVSAGVAGVGNRGLGNEGLYLMPGKEYEGFFFVKSDTAVTLEVQLTGGDESPEVLASQQIKHAPPAADTPPYSKANPGWVRHDFKLTPTKAAECVGIAPGGQNMRDGYGLVNVRIADAAGMSPLHWGCARSHAMVVEALLDAHADLLAATRLGFTPLHLACLAGGVEVVEVLLQRGHTPELLSRTAKCDGSTALHCAALGGHSGVVDVLLEQGANVAARNRMGTPAQWAKKKHPELAERLQRLQ